MVTLNVHNNIAFLSPPENVYGAGMSKAIEISASLSTITNTYNVSKYATATSARNATQRHPT